MRMEETNKFNDMDDERTVANICQGKSFLSLKRKAVFSDRACVFGYHQVLEMLSSNKQEKFKNIENTTTILQSCIECDAAKLRYMLKAHDLSIDFVNERDSSGKTGISHACANGFTEIVEILLEIKETDINLPDNEGTTPLIFAAQAGHLDIVKLLLRSQKRLHIDAVNDLGFSALMKAAIQGRIRCAKYLIFAGASPKLRDFGRGLCAEEWANLCGRHDCADAINGYRSSKRYLLAKVRNRYRDFVGDKNVVRVHSSTSKSNTKCSFRRSHKESLSPQNRASSQNASPFLSLKTSMNSARNGKN